MRKSLLDLPRRMVAKDDYPGLPEELREFNYRLMDSGRCLMIVPMCLLAEAKKNGSELYLYEVAIPVKYVLEKGYQISDGYILCDVPYDKRMGVDIPESYYEYD